ncbi:MAG TPA: GMC family oxidoreductase [Solirubrobacteraceae bacterium]|nr:GMC family oxidoreductase [Solirubrobacteraceae bacterium]
MGVELTDLQRGTLECLCDTLVPCVERAEDPTGFWARRASDLGVAAGVEQILGQIPDEGVRSGLQSLLEILAAQGFSPARSQPSREQLLRNMCLASAEAAAGLGALTAMTLFLTYGAPDPQTLRNPNWEMFGYPGPISAPPATPKEIEPLVPSGPEAELEADVCVVGSGAGGGVIAGTLAQQGRQVVVLEAAGYFNEADFAQLELKAYQEMYWRGGPTPTADGNVSLQAGTSLGGGTTINWTNCLRTTPWVREQWAQEHGLEGVDGAEFDRHLDTVLERIGATDACSELNGPQQRMREGCERLQWSFRTVVRNTDPATYSPDSAGYLGFGDQSGSKQSTTKTFLRDAVAHDAQIVVRCRAQRILTEHGRAVGVEAVYTSEAGEQVGVRVNAPCVVVAAGALESPALLLRSGIGGPAVGQYLRLHPCVAVLGIHQTDQRAWWGAPHAGLSDEFANTGEGYGFLIEGAQYAPAITGSAVPWTSGAEHKEMMSQMRNGASFIALTRDRGHGQVVLDPRGEATPLYSVTDELDQRNLRHGLEALVRLHEASGARQILSLSAGMPRWRVGDDLDAYIAQIQAIPLRAGGHRLFSAHQMGTCRMGVDPATSVAGPWGELHDTAGVWIGDGSAFPTPSGTNPMVSIMALAHRTAEAIAAGSQTRTSERVGTTTV